MNVTIHDKIILCNNPKQVKIYVHHILTPVPVGIVISSVVWIILLFHNWLNGGFLATLTKEKHENRNANKNENIAYDRDHKDTVRRSSPWIKKRPDKSMMMVTLDTERFAADELSLLQVAGSIVPVNVVRVAHTLTTKN